MMQRKKQHSFGIIPIKLFDYKIRFMVIQKRHTYAYLDFMRGMYDEDDDEQLSEKFNLMTFQELSWIANLSNEALWEVTWLTKEHFPSYPTCMKRLSSVREKPNFKELINSAEGVRATNWEFPKGHKCKITEKDYECAAREFREETGWETITILKEIDPITIEFLGTDKKKYTVVYYIAYCMDKPRSYLKPSARHQACEIMSYDWISRKEIKSRIDGKKGKDLYAEIDSRYKKICDSINMLSMSQRALALTTSAASVSLVSSVKSSSSSTISFLEIP